MKSKFDSSMKNAAMTTVMSLVSGIVARALAAMSPDRAGDILSKPKEILGMKLPPELATTLGGGFAGLTVVEILKHLMPGMPEQTLDWIQDFAVMVGERYEHVTKNGGPMSDAQPTSAKHYSRKVLLQSDAYPGVIFHIDCGTPHHNTTTVKEETDAKGKKRKVASTEPRSDFRTVSDEAAAALMSKNGRTPSATEDGADVNCTCDILVAAQLDRYYAAEAVAKKEKPPEAKKKDDEPPVSFQDFLGQAQAGKYPGIGLAQLDSLLVILKDLNQSELAKLDRAINTVGEFRGLFLAKTVDDVRKMITLADDRYVHHGIAYALDIPVATAHRVADKAKVAWDKAGEWAVEAEKRADQRTADLILKRVRARQAIKPVTPQPTVSFGKRAWRFFLGGEW
jgi:hypothetical protein